MGIHRETIMEQVGRYYLPDDWLRQESPQATDAEHVRMRRERVKMLFNSLDMDGTLAAWRVRQGIPPYLRPIEGLRVTAGGRTWSLRAYIAAQEVGSHWLARQLPAMHEFVRAWRRCRRGQVQHPERTLASYVFQEAEGLSRAAKLWWCRIGGHTVHNLQHDGVVVTLAREMSGDEATRALGEVCSHALAYRQEVEVK